MNTFISSNDLRRELFEIRASINGDFHVKSKRKQFFDSQTEQEVYVMQMVSKNEIGFLRRDREKTQILSRKAVAMEFCRK